MGQVWYLIVSIPGPCCLSYFVPDRGPRGRSTGSVKHLPTSHRHVRGIMQELSPPGQSMLDLHCWHHPASVQHLRI